MIKKRHKLIGRGRFSHVRALSATLAMKICELGYDAKQELAILKELKHPNLIALVSQRIENYRHVLVFKRYKMDLYQRMKTPIKNKNRIVLGMLAGLAAIHDHGWFHRDIKPENMLVDDNDDVVISDFGTFYVLFYVSCYVSFYSLKTNKKQDGQDAMCLLSNTRWSLTCLNIKHPSSCLIKTHTIPKKSTFGLLDW